MLKPFHLLLLIWAVSLGASLSTAQQPALSPAPQTGPELDEWADNFDGNALDADKWERFTFEGGGGGRVEVEGGQLRMRGIGASRSGVRSKQAFNGDRFIVEATVASVGHALPLPGQTSTPVGNAILTMLFDGAGRNRIEWLLTSEGRFEAWSVVNGRGERLDKRNLATTTKNPVLSIARRGDEFFFALNGEVGLQKTIRNMPREFRVMLYGFGSSENNWDSVRVMTARQR